MRFLADESCDFAVVRALRGAGHDVTSIAEQAAGTVDADVIEQCFADDRILLTEDKDFGWLVYVSRTRSPGVVLLRFPAKARRWVVDTAVQAVRRFGARLRCAFTVVQPGRVRIARTPGL